MRHDWPDLDNSLWQMKCVNIPEGTGYCEDCKDKYTGNYKNLVPACSKCETYTMVYNL